jgi:hypothetical protein
VGADFIDVSDALAGHELSCSPFRWVHRLTFLRGRVVSPTRFTQRGGYQAVAEAVELQLIDLALG